MASLIKFVNSFLETRDSILQLSGIGNDSRVNELFAGISKCNNVIPLGGNSLQEGVNFLLLLEQCCEIPSNWAHFVQFIIKHGQSISKIFSSLIKLAYCCSSILEILCLVLQAVSEMAQPVTKAVDNVSNGSAIRSKGISIIEQILSSFLNLHEISLQILCLLKKSFDFVQKSGVLVGPICLLQLVLSPLQSIGQISGIVIEFPKLAKQVSNSLSPISNEMIKTVPPFFHVGQLLFDNFLVSVTGCLEGVTSSLVCIKL